MKQVMHDIVRPSINKMNDKINPLITDDTYHYIHTTIQKSKNYIRHYVEGVLYETS